MARYSGNILAFVESFGPCYFGTFWDIFFSTVVTLVTVSSGLNNLKIKKIKKK